MTDPIADMITRIRNGYLARNKTVEIPHSRIKAELAKILVEEKFLTKMEITGKTPSEKKIGLELRYENKQPAISKIKRISTPGRRIYARADKIPAVRQGFGITLVSTSVGLMTNRKAKNKNLGGEIICQVW